MTKDEDDHDCSGYQEGESSKDGEVPDQPEQTDEQQGAGRQKEENTDSEPVQLSKVRVGSKAVEIVGIADLPCSNPGRYADRRAKEGNRECAAIQANLREQENEGGR